MFLQYLYNKVSSVFVQTRDIDGMKEGKLVEVCNLSKNLLSACFVR